MAAMFRLAGVEAADYNVWMSQQRGGLVRGQAGGEPNWFGSGRV